MTPLLSGILGASIGCVVTWWLGRNRQRRELAQLTDHIERHETELPAQTILPARDQDIVRLHRAVVEVIEHFEHHVTQLEQQKLELDAILAGMVEGVVAVDRHQSLFTINRAATEMLRAPAEEARGRPLIEITRNAPLHQLVQQVLDTGESHHAEFILGTDPPRTVRAQGAPLRDRDEAMLGAVVVLEDITQLKRLENVRRDFVANVSHELKTPITSIKGYIETLLDFESLTPEQVSRFLRIVAKQSDRLDAIINDLLALAHVEQLADSRAVRLTRQPLAPILAESIELAQSADRDHRVAIRLECPPDLSAVVNAPLLEQAVTNLIHNACKYSPEEETVVVAVQETDEEISIDVIDRGCGIEARHLPRLFERFYRVDKSRSRKLGGTGLGLAIVKHIALAHGGDVSVESTPGKGSRFRLSLPLADQERQ